MGKLNQVILSTVLAVTLASTAASAQCSSNGCIVYGNNSSSCCLTVVPSPPEPSASRPPQENLEILLQRAKEETKGLEDSWFSSGQKLAAARNKVAVYKKLLIDLPE